MEAATKPRKVAPQVLCFAPPRRGQQQGPRPSLRGSGRSTL